MHPTIELGNGEHLACEWVLPRDGQPLALYLHGLGSHRNGEKAGYLARELTARGFGFARFDFRGHGDSTGRLEELTLSRLLADVAAVVEHLASGRAGRPPRSLLLIGSSLGGLAAAWRSVLAPELPLPIAGQVLIAPAFRMVERYLAKIGAAGCDRWEHEGAFRFRGPWFEFALSWAAVVDARGYPHEQLLRKTRVPTLLLHGDADDTTPLAESEAFAAGCSNAPRLIVLAGGDHRLTSFREQLRDEIVRFVERDAQCA
ncbi:MAG: alpha/beta fold hydrolase [Planctomycetes bacterium]|nr:alpha/beta fold hydrolase [Planctomycetota bacterium]